MNREQVFLRLEEIFTGEPRKQHGTIREYWSLSPQEGLAKAEAYLKSSWEAQDGSRSDWAYWMYEGDLTLAAVLIGVFKRLAAGKQDFPEPPDRAGAMLMDRTAALQEWAANLEGAS